ncbi:MAG TPA: glycosyltransferase, partial [Chitinophagaceae bacterium]|nr:glycosyltransferase [Chitinophagaceae bacterium]
MEKVESYPLITVVIPTYNRASLIKKAIGSVLVQTHTNLELIIADDGSADDTKEVVSSVNDPRIKWIGLPHTGHIGKVRNAGALAGKGEWIAFLDSDDEWLPGKLQCQVEALRTTGHRWCYTNFELMNEKGITVVPKAGSYHPHSGRITGKLLTNEATVVVCTLLVEKKLFDSAGGFSTDERLAWRGDYEFALRLSLKEEVTALPGILVRILEH